MTRPEESSVEQDVDLRRAQNEGISIRHELINDCELVSVDRFSLNNVGVQTSGNGSG
jgi:hypothetical protein